MAAGLGLWLCDCSQPVPASGTYTISVPYDLESLDPGARNRLSDFSLVSNLYEPLVSTDADLSARPGLAVRWTNPDALTWVFELRPGVRFHDGRPLTAEDVVWTCERLRGGSRLEMSGHVSSFRSVRALDERTVEIRTAAPVGILLNKLRFILIVRRGESGVTSRGQVNGTGPFRLASWEKGRSLSLERNTDYWGPAPALERVRFVLNRAPGEALDDFLTGRSQFIQSNAKSTEDSLGGRHGVRIRRNGSISVKFLYFAMAGADPGDFAGGRNPFQDVRVRKAVSLAIDREELVRRLSVLAGPASQLVPPYIFGFDPAREPLRFDPAEARRLLAEAGWVDGFDLTFHARGLFSEAAGLVAEMLGRVGIRARVAALAEAEWFAAMDGRRFAMTLNRFGCPTGDASDLLEGLVHTHDPGRAMGLMNYTGYSSPEVDALVERAGRTLEMGRRQPILFEATGRVMEDLPIVPLYIDQDSYAFLEGVEWKPRNDNFLIASEISGTR